MEEPSYDILSVENGLILTLWYPWGKVIRTWPIS